MNGQQRRPIADAYWQESNPHKRMGDNAETFTEFHQRVTSFMLQLQDIPNGAVLFGHGIWIGMLIWKLLGLSSIDSMGMKSFRSFQLGLPMPNGAVYRFQETSPGQWHAQMDEAIMRTLVDVSLTPVTTPSLSSAFLAS